MKGACNRGDCSIKDDLPCEMGHDRPEDCPHFQAAISTGLEGSESVVADDADGHRLPWTGRGLGLNDIGLASARSPAQLVGLVGPYNAGKTAFLTAMFSHFSRTAVLDDHAFAGSFSLQAWSRLKKFTTWPAVQEPMFPPHTPDSSERAPSLLHLAFRRRHELIRDLLFTDAPGEWFTRWMRNQAAEEAKGARWIAEHASCFLLVVDRAGLAGADVGLVRQNTLALARLIGEHRRGRPVAAVWTKSDGHCDEEIEAQVRARLNEFFGEHPTFNVAVDDAACLRVLSFLLATQQPVTHLPVHRMASARSAFLAYGTTPL
jgi:hypothetical protein